MKHTKEQLQGMSDLEVNTELANLLGFDDTMRYAESHLILNYNSTLPGQELKNVNYCNNPSDIMPLAFEHKLTISPQLERFDIPSTGLWVSTDQNWNDKYSVMDKKPLRAIACCLILVLQDKE